MSVTVSGPEVKFNRFLYECTDDERWIGAVSVGDIDFRVYCDSDGFEVSPAGCAKYSTFKWEDPMFGNSRGSVEHCMMLAAFNVYLAD